jgi:uncharacterized membrane protein
VIVELDNEAWSKLWVFEGFWSLYPETCVKVELPEGLRLAYLYAH